MIRRITAVEARTIASWHYEPPFDIYDGDPSDASMFERDDHWALVADDELVGFCCFGTEARVPQQSEERGTLDVGMGIAPDRVSQGLASRLLPEVLAFGAEQFAPVRFRVAVASFNERSLRLCRTAGFVAVRTFEGPGGREFTELVADAPS